MEIIDKIPLNINPQKVIRALHLDKKKDQLEGMINQLLEEVEQIANPKALYKVSYIEIKTDNTVKIDGVIFESRVLRINLENAERVFPYIVTAGRELESIKISKQDFMKIFCLDAIKELVLKEASEYLTNYLKEKFIPGKLSHMSPGSLSDWPVTQQKQLFSLFGDVEKLIGVRLTESFIMDPIKSVSGIHFPTQFDFKSCMLCKRERCPSRKASYNPEMAEKYKIST